MDTKKMRKSELAKIIKKDKKLVQDVLDILKPIIIEEIERKLHGKITGSSILACKKVIEEMRI